MLINEINSLISSNFLNYRYLAFKFYKKSQQKRVSLFPVKKKKKNSIGKAGFSVSLSESEAVSGIAIVLAKVKSDMSRDLLSMLVENVSGLDESDYSLEIIWEINKAVVTFNRPVGKRGNTPSHTPTGAKNNMDKEHMTWR